MIAALAVNRKDRELDVVLLSAASGEVVRNLTSGFDQNYGFEFISAPGARFNTVPRLSWAPDGDRLAYFVRKGKHRSLVVQNVVSREIEHLIDLEMVDEPESPDFSPDGRTVAFSALRDGVGDIYEIDLATREVTNLTRSDFADYAPIYAPDGSYIVHMTRVSGNNKLFRRDGQTGLQTQLTFGTHDDSGPQFLDERTVMFASTAVDPTQPLDPDTARDGEIFNIWTLDLVNGELRQLTDTATGNVNPVRLAPDEDGERDRIGFITYFKSEYGVHTIELQDPLYTASTSDFGGPGPIIDFQAPLTHTLNPGNVRRKGRFENMFMEGRPPINFGVTNSGDLLGGTAITFADVLGDQQLSLQAYSIDTYRTFGGTYANRSSRLQYALQGFSTEQFFYGLYPGIASTAASGSSAARTPSPRGACGAATPSASTPSTASGASSSRRGSSTRGSRSTTRTCGSSPTPSSSGSSGRRCSRTAPTCRSASATCRRRRCSGSSDRCRATR